MDLIMDLKSSILINPQYRFTFDNITSHNTTNGMAC